jgi:hypothetical protein
MSTLLAPLLVGAALAQPVGHYHPDDVAARSKVFVAAAEKMGPAFEQAQQDLGALGRGLQALEVGTNLLGARVPAGFGDWADTQRRTVTGQYLRVQKHVDLVQEDFGGVFGGALERALAAQGGALKECTKGSGVQALMRRPGAGCPGEDRNGALARALDGDAQLKADVAEILDIPFPEIGVEPRAWAAVPITGTGRWVSAAALAKAHAGPVLERESAALEARLAPLEGRIAAGDAAAVAEAAEARAAYEAALAAAGATLLDAAAKALEKAGAGDVGVCPNAAGFGGCEGADATKEVLRILAADKRFTKAAAGL